MVLLAAASLPPPPPQLGTITTPNWYYYKYHHIQTVIIVAAYSIDHIITMIVKSHFTPITFSSLSLCVGRGPWCFNAPVQARDQEPASLPFPFDILVQFMHRCRIIYVTSSPSFVGTNKHGQGQNTT